jgi:hypothetical protein
MKYAVIANPQTDGTRECSGTIESRHRTVAGAWAAFDKRQRACRRANPGCQLMLAVVAVTAHGETWARGRQVARYD